ncbi:hypothetical protein AB0395_30720 [Streptosporangium sp. NPDC051023]|uniref:hypothetical protein n=1 Tax=Streptosporangium sp. NPDC051023 TaxID=3155410 RepID=UPI00344F6905
MSGEFVTAHLFRPEHMLVVDRIPSPSGAVSRPGTPAILVTSREGPVREPHVMLLTRGRRRHGVPPGARVFGGTHVVARLGDLADRDWCEVADVLVDRGRAVAVAADSVSGVLDRYPGCEVAVGRHEHGCLAGLRDGRFITITGSVGGSPWPMLCGSFLYGWQVARMPFGDLTVAPVTVGRYTASSPGSPGALEVTGKAQIRLTRRFPRNTGGEST